MRGYGRSTTSAWIPSKSRSIRKTARSQCLITEKVFRSRCIAKKEYGFQRWFSVICQWRIRRRDGWAQYGCWYASLTPDRLTSSNYDDDQKKLTGGRNGYGAKLANIYSLEFSECDKGVVMVRWRLTHRFFWIAVETADKNTLKKYKQAFSNNMSVKGKPKVRVVSIWVHIDLLLTLLPSDHW